MKGGETDGERRKWWRVKGEGRTGSEGGGEGVVVLGFVFVLGRSFTFVGARLCSWQGHCVWVLVISGGLLLSLGRVVCGRCHCLWGWVVICGYHVIVCGCWVSLWGARLLFGDGRCHLWASGCCSWVVDCHLWAV